jgi:hypothetical protein
MYHITKRNLLSTCLIVHASPTYSRQATLQALGKLYCLRLRSWPLGNWDRGFESHSMYGCLSASFSVVLSCALRRTDPSSMQSYQLSKNETGSKTWQKILQKVQGSDWAQRMCSRQAMQQHCILSIMNRWGLCAFTPSSLTEQNL